MFESHLSISADRRNALPVTLRVSNRLSDLAFRQTQILRIFLSWLVAGYHIDEVTKFRIREEFANWVVCVGALVPSVLNSLTNVDFIEFFEYIVTKRKLYIFASIDLIEVVTWIGWFKEWHGRYPTADRTNQQLDRLDIARRDTRIITGGVKLNDFGDAFESENVQELAGAAGRSYAEDLPNRGRPASFWEQEDTGGEMRRISINRIR